MSWDISLHCVCCGNSLFDQNYTHNTSKMIYAVLGDELERNESWYQRLNGMKRKQGIKYLERIIEGLSNEPARFRAMNPSNGWGDYDRLLKVLCDLRDKAADIKHKALWEAWG